MLTVEERVIKGFDVLTDVYGPEWQDAIDVEALDLYSVCNCILGQLEGDYWNAYENDSLANGRWVSPESFAQWAVDHGFASGIQPDDPGDNYGDYSERVFNSYKELTQAWRNKLG